MNFNVQVCLLTDRSFVDGYETFETKQKREKNSQIIESNY